MHARHTISSRSCIWGGVGWSFGGFRDWVGAVQGTRFQFVWQLATAKDYGPHPIASLRPLKTPRPACFGPGDSRMPSRKSLGRERISGGLGGTRVCGLYDD